MDAPGVAGPNVLTAEAPATVDGIVAALAAAARDLRDLWTESVAHGRATEATRLVEASHAVHRALVALRADAVITTGPVAGRGPRP